ncbi:peroxidasin-like protein [Coregonus clupeaformis]|uniref:peroxidasin-like protein n=1 Tax=Coregonus clupeaformis TaxID=59861 RepID=UPI001BE016C8|nr:peroxidasin-like protein [Coregonus clupeaformis]
MLVGQKVQMHCMGSLDEKKYSWYHLNQTTSMNNDSNLLTLLVTTEDSGEYKCSGYYNGTVYYSNAVHLTVVERLSNVSVSSTPKDLVTMEGQSVTLYCQATSHPPSVVWSWSRLDEQGGWQEVGIGRELTLRLARESGQYFCQAHSKILVLTQQQKSPFHTVCILYFPMTGNLLIHHNIHLDSHIVYAGVAGLVLVLLSWVLLLLVLLWFWRQRAKERAGQETLAINSAPAKGFTGPAKPPKGRSQPQAQAGDEGEIYMNCGETNQAYSDLCPAYMTGDDTYATLG